MLHFDPCVLVAWMKDGRIPEMTLISERLPEDAVIVGCGFDVSRQQVVVAVESLEFDLVANNVGAGIPQVEIPSWGLRGRKEA